MQLHPTLCAICGTADNAMELFPSNFNAQSFNPGIFSARRLPDRIHYRMVKCSTCGLVRSDPIASPEVLAQLYTRSSFDYAEEIENLRRTYRRYLTKLLNCGALQGALLEIGCGNGFFLEEALAQGYLVVQGVEPSAVAIAKANPQVRARIICDVMRPGLLRPAQFDVVCMFQVLDHIPDPRSVLEECFRLLKPEGLVLCLNHNVEAHSARLLGERSPIVDLEHTYLYNPSTLSRLFETCRFDVLRVGSAWNTYSLYYLLRLVPLSAKLKTRILAWLKSRAVGRVCLSLPLGNLYLVARKPST
jgi:SAM-dependent methyltransferase